MGKKKIQTKVDLGDLNSNFLNEVIKEKFVDTKRENNDNEIEQDEEGIIDKRINDEILTKNWT